MRAHAELESKTSSPPEGLGPDEELSAEFRDDGARAGCAVWWRRTPPYPGHRVGLVGRYRADSVSSGAAVLSEACRLLAGRGCTLAVGPMDGSTWHRYRLVTDAGSRPPFFLEPDNPPEWPVHFAAAGFGPLARYSSAVTPPLDGVALPEPTPTGHVLLRPLDLDDYETELRRIHRLSVECFRDNLLFTPIAWEEFAALYRPLRPHLREGLSWIAQSGRALAGFAFGVPDLLQARREGTVDTVILKTLATRPDLRGGGLGQALVAQCVREARRRAYRYVVLALIREGNPSGRIAARYGQPIRSYTLFARELGTP